MMTPDLRDYLLEYESEGIGDLLYSLIAGVVKHDAPRYPPGVYSPNQVWDEDAVSSISHDFIMDKLLKAGRLEHHLLAQENLAGLKKALRYDFRQFLINHRHRTEYLNIFLRVKKILYNDSRFRALNQDSSLSTSIWGLGQWTNKDIAQKLEEVVEAMFAVELPPLVQYRPDSKKLSHLLSNNGLADLLELTFRRIDKYISINLVMDGVRYRLNLLDTDPISLDEPLEQESDNSLVTKGDFIPDPTDLETQLTVSQITEDLFEQLSDRQRRVLALRLSTPESTLERLGELIGISKSTIYNDLTAIERLISNTDLTQEEAEQTLARLSELCTHYLEEDIGQAK